MPRPVGQCPPRAAGNGPGATPVAGAEKFAGTAFVFIHGFNTPFDKAMFRTAQIAYDLDVSEATIKAHITAVFRKLGVRNRTQAVIAIQQMEIDPSEQSLSGG